MKDNTLAIFVLFYEKVDQTIECITSFLPSNLNIYVLNNNSSTDSLHKLESFCADKSTVTIFNSNENLGVSRGRNYLIEKTQEEWMFFIDNDITIQTVDWLPRALNHIRNESNILVFIPKLFNLQKNIYERPQNFVLNSNKAYISKNYAKVITNMFPGGCSIINRKIYEKWGLYDEQMFVGFEDFEFALRGLIANDPIQAKIIDDIELIHDHRIVKTSEDKKALLGRYNQDRLQKSHDRILEKHNIDFQHKWKKWNRMQINIMQNNKSIKTIFYKIIENFKYQIKTYLEQLNIQL